MVRLDRICVYLFLLGVTLMVPSNTHITFLDELISFLFLGVAIVDCVFNGNFRKYKLLWVITLIMTAYAAYSITFLSYNSTAYILKDWIIELKPFIPLCVFLAIGPVFNASDRKYLRAMSIINVIIIAIIFCGGQSVIKSTMTHISYGSQYAFISGLLYYYCSRDINTGSVSRMNIWTSVLLMSVGIFGFRSKFYGEFIFALFFLFIYRPGMLRNFNVKHSVTILIICGIVLAASWSKIQYYFLSGNSGSFDPTVVESFARPVLYVTGAMILIDHFPFGTGLASFASYTSGESYSNVYYEYGINEVFGLSPQKPDFICDAFYPSLAQFGVVGILLFSWFWFYVYSYLRRLIRFDAKKYKPLFIMGSLCIIFNLIEATSATTLTQVGGVITMALLGLCCAYGKKLPKESAQTYSPKKEFKRKI